MKSLFFSLLLSFTLAVSLITIAPSLGINKLNSTAEAKIAQLEQCYLIFILPDEGGEETVVDCQPEGDPDMECDSTEGECG